MTDKGKLSIKQSDICAIEADSLFADLQSRWDEQSVRIDRALAASDVAIMKELPMKPRPSVPLRIRMLAVYVVLFVVSVAAAAYWGFLIPSLAFNALALVVSLVIELIYILLVAECLYEAVSLIILSPTRVGTLRMSRHYRRTHMQDKTPMLQMRRPVVACIAAVIALTVASCTITGIDDCFITQNHLGRTATIETVSNVINQL
ncbi:MAG: hypothetical protein MJZ51_04550 [Bacteroidales bacterium]|nr:hypothetical protein [Bacteroidales bacterium]